jgi:uridine kinase
MILGICGGSGSGKTTLLRQIALQYSELNPTVFSMDNYYLSIEKQHIDCNGKVNFDLPTALDKNRLIDDLNNLKAGNSIEVKEYHFNTKPEKQVLITLEHSPLIIVEGLFLFYYQEVNDLLDYTVFMQVDAETQLDRRLYRDQETRGYTREEIMYQWNEHVLPCYEQYLLPYYSKADFVFHNDHRSTSEFEKLKEILDSKLACINPS